MFESLKICYNQTAKFKKELKKLRDEYLFLIYRGFVKDMSIREIHRDLYKRTIIEEGKYSNNLLRASYSIAKALNDYKIDFGDDDMEDEIDEEEKLLDYVVEKLTSPLVLGNLNRIINEETRRYENDMKIEIIEDTLKENREKDIYFYVASSHGDCAKDHLEAQGKVYVDEAYINSGNEEVIKYIRNNNIQVMQYIIGSPTYFITRPYCRHYFVAYTSKDILSGNYKIPHTEIGNRRYKTPKNATIESLEQNLGLYERMYRLHKTEDLKILINKTKLLISKYKV